MPNGIKEILIIRFQLKSNRLSNPKLFSGGDSLFYREKYISNFISREGKGMKNYPIFNLLIALVFLLLLIAGKKILDNYLAALIIFGTFFCIYLGRAILYLIRHFDEQKSNRIPVKRKHK
jgi:hypothetical protein